MQYLNYRNIYGRMSNHFYLALQCFILKQKSGIETKYLTNNYFQEHNIFEILKTFNMDNYVELDGKNYTIINQQDGSIGYLYRQMFNENFNEDELNEFIKQTFLTTNLFNELISSDDTVALHIRNGDYISSTVSNFFDREKYISSALNYFGKNIKKILVFSDEIELSKNFLLKFNDNYEIIYSKNINGESDGIKDFISLSCVKNKILLNSTFSYWTAFIGNVIFNDSYKNVVAPDKFSTVEPNTRRLNPKWSVIAV